MKKHIYLLLLTLSILQSCHDNIKAPVYTLEIEYCNGKIDTVDYQSIFYPKIKTYKQAVPIIDKTNGWGEPTLINVCKFTVLNIRKY